MAPTVVHHVDAMYNPLSEMVKDLAIAQAASRGPIDPDRAEAFEARTFRRRVASIAWLPGVALVLTVGGWTGSAVVGIAGFVVLLPALWIYAEHGDRVAARLRRGRS